MLSEAKHLKLAGPYTSRAINQRFFAALRMTESHVDHEKKRTAYSIVMLSEAKHLWLTIN